MKIPTTFLYFKNMSRKLWKPTFVREKYIYYSNVGLCMLPLWAGRKGQDKELFLLSENSLIRNSHPIFPTPRSRRTRMHFSSAWASSTPRYSSGFVLFLSLFLLAFLPFSLLVLLPLLALTFSVFKTLLLYISVFHMWQKLSRRLSLWEVLFFNAEIMAKCQARIFESISNVIY